MLQKQVDSKGRLTLGRKFSGSTMLVEEAADGTIILRPAVVIPANEAWLWKNKTALAAVRSGLNQARHREFVKGPDVDADAALAKQLEG